MTVLPSVKLERGLHLLHWFGRLDRERWARLRPGDSQEVRRRLEKLCATYSTSPHPRLCTYAGLGGKADLGFMLYADDLVRLAQMHRNLETCFPAGCLQPVFSFVSITTVGPDQPEPAVLRHQLIELERLDPASAAFQQRWAQVQQERAELEQSRLYPELPDWELMAFYPMNRRRQATDNWYLLDEPTRQRLAEDHERLARALAAPVLQLVTAAVGLDDWEWGVTLVAHQADALHQFVYSMRFDPATARYTDFGPVFLNLRLRPAALWEHLGL